MTNDEFGERCKLFEALSEQKAMPGLPLLARLDGRAFHTFTSGLVRPYDQGMSTCMIETTRFLVDKTHALIGYTQSDEITLAWFHHANSRAQYDFDGRIQKTASVLAGMASAKFCQLVLKHLPQKADKIPHFDCRVWQVPTLEAAADVFIWREADATKNSITMAASSVYSHKELHEKNSAEKQEMLFQKGINWSDYPAFFKRGSYLQRKTVARELSETERLKIREQNRPPAGQIFQRSEIVELDLPPIRTIENLISVLFRHEKPIHLDPLSS